MPTQYIELAIFPVAIDREHSVSDAVSNTSLEYIAILNNCHSFYPATKSTLLLVAQVESTANLQKTIYFSLSLFFYTVFVLAYTSRLSCAFYSVLGGVRWTGFAVLLEYRFGHRKEEDMPKEWGWGGEKGWVALGLYLGMSLGTEKRRIRKYVVLKG